MFRRSPHIIIQSSWKRCLIQVNLERIIVTQRLFTGGSSNNSSSKIEDDKAELERERALREKFAAKIHNVVNNSYKSKIPNVEGNNEDKGSTSRQLGSFGHIVFFLMTIYLIFVLKQLDNPNNNYLIFQGIPWWQLPVDTLAYFLLNRAILPYRLQFSIKSEYEAESKVNPMLTYAQFMDLKYPTLLQGYRTQQREIVSALAACYTVSTDMNLQNVVVGAARARDPKQAVDDIMAALYKEYPGVFMPPAPVIDPNYSQPHGVLNSPL